MHFRGLEGLGRVRCGIGRVLEVCTAAAAGLPHFGPRQPHPPYATTAGVPRVALRQPRVPRVFWHFFDLFGHILGYRTPIEMSLIPLESLLLGLHFL